MVSANYDRIMNDFVETMYIWPVILYSFSSHWGLFAAVGRPNSTALGEFALSLEEYSIELMRPWSVHRLVRI